MGSPSKLKNAGITPGKLVLIGILGAILIVLVVYQVVQSRKPVQGGPRNASSTDGGRDDAGTAPATGRDGGDDVESPPTWPLLTLDECLRHDPFVLPVELQPKPEVDEEPGPALSIVEVQRQRQAEDEERRRQREEVLERLQGQGVGILLITPDGPVATIGTTTVRVGDHLDGFRVSKIDSTGVYLVDDRRQDP